MALFSSQGRVQGSCPGTNYSSTKEHAAHFKYCTVTKEDVNEHDVANDSYEVFKIFEKGQLLLQDFSLVVRFILSGTFKRHFFLNKAIGH